MVLPMPNSSGNSIDREKGLSLPSEQEDTFLVAYMEETCRLTLGGLDGWVTGVGDFGSIKRTYASGRFYEHDFLDYVAAIGRRGTYLDIGGCIGNHSVFMARFCSSNRVFTYEPREDFIQIIRENCKTNEVDTRVTIRPVFVSDTAADRHVRLDDEGLENVCILKVDVEGQEFGVLKSAQKILQNDRPIIYCESFAGDSYDEITEWLATLNYTPTGRVFNQTPLFEFYPSEGLSGNGKNPVSENLLGDSKAGHRFTVTDKGYRYISLEDKWVDFLAKESIELTEVLSSSRRLWFNLDAKLNEEQDISVWWQFLDGERELAVEKFSARKGRMQPLSIPTGVTRIRPIIRISGKGALTLHALNVHLI